MTKKGGQYCPRKDGHFEPRKGVNIPRDLVVFLICD